MCCQFTRPMMVDSVGGEEGEQPLCATGQERDFKDTIPQAQICEAN